MFLNESCLFCDCQTASITGSVAPFNWWGHSHAAHDTGSLCTAAGNMLQIGSWFYSCSMKGSTGISARWCSVFWCLQEHRTGLKHIRNSQPFIWRPRCIYILYLFLNKNSKILLMTNKTTWSVSLRTPKQRMSVCRKQPWKHQDDAKTLMA